MYFYILIRSWNTKQYLDRCLNSALRQRYKSFRILFVDDASGLSKKEKQKLKQILSNHTVVFNKKRKYSVRNAFEMIKRFAQKRDSVIVVLDGDDYFANNRVLDYLNKIYDQDSELAFTYGSSYVLKNNHIISPKKKTIPYFNTKYPKRVEINKSYRREPFRIGHPMTFRTTAFLKIPKSEFLERPGIWLKYSFDMALFLPLLETGVKGMHLKKLLYVYNTDSLHTNANSNIYNFLREDVVIRTKKTINKIPSGQKVIFIGEKRNPLIPVRGKLYYFLQYYFFKNGLTKYLRIPTTNAVHRNKIFCEINKSNCTVICLTYKFGVLLKTIDRPIISDWISPENLSGLTAQKLHEVSWTLILSSFVTRKTKISLGNFLPKHFPVFETQKKVVGSF